MIEPENSGCECWYLSQILSYYLNYYLMKFFSYIIICCTLLISCTSNNHIKFGYLESLKPEPNEKQLSITKLHLDFYEKYLFVDSSDILLNRVISNRNNYIYISLSTKNTPENFEKQMKSRKGFTFYSNKKFEANKKKFTSFFIKNSDQYFNRILYVEPDVKDLIVFDFISKDSLTVAEFYNNHQKFTQKINCE